MYGPITTLHRKNQRTRDTPWSAFKLMDNGWIKVVNACNILADSNNIQQYFSSGKQPMLWRALPALEDLLSAWEKKCNSPCYTLYKDALNAVLRIQDNHYPLWTIIPLPVFKLVYIEVAWGGAKEQAAEIAKGNADAKNWQDKARKVFDGKFKL
ncbi:hypothetical protein B0H34DRAFT_755203 [Crassisporium funariophilum]|nr:hypothetical protein B0H34DRAFT_755203 [Crassisporium funariophilum]